MKCIQISILGRIYGNVNADEAIGTRTTIKKMYDSEGNIYPFVSARAIKFAIRQKLKEKFGEEAIDPLKNQSEQWLDSGEPWKYVDNDLFGYLVPTGGKNFGKRRSAPVSISYFKAIKNTPVNTDFGIRAPRSEGNPNIFEVEVADIIGKLNVLINEYIGKPSPYDNEKWEKELPSEERKKRLKTLLEILLIDRFVLPRKTNSLNIPEYYYALISFSENPLPIYQYLDFDVIENNIPKIDLKKLNTLLSLVSNLDKKPILYIIDYTGSLQENEITLNNCKIQVKKPSELSKLIEELANNLISK